MPPRSQKFFRTALEKVAAHSKSVIDIGGSLRITQGKGNRFDPEGLWMKDILRGVTYRILDPVPDYQPDIVGDIHALPFDDNSQDAIICVSVLEHVEDPIRACKEIYRVLKPGGMALIYIPFLYYYHAETGYYKDYWRFTADTVDLLFRDFSEIQKENVRGALETVVHLFPFGRNAALIATARFFDRMLGKINSKQTSGHNIFLVK